MFNAKHAAAVAVAFATHPVFAATLPIQGTEAAKHWDMLYWFLIGLSAVFFVLVVGAMIYFAIEYRAGKGHKTKYLTGSHSLEAVFVAIPTVLLMIIFGWGFMVYHEMVTPGADPYVVRVIGKQWLWQYQYDNGRTTIGDVFVPVNKPVKFVMTSEDVLHSFFIPNFRIKQDVVPGMYTSVSFEATVPGKHQVYCAEYCGTAHSGMLGQVIALEEDEWNAWNRGKKISPDSIPVAGQEGVTPAQAKAAHEAAETMPLADQGKKLFETKGCVACHSVDGTTKVGPSQKGIFGHKVELADGSTVTADENYIRESIENPQAKVVKGFAPTMPAFKGLISETEMNALIAYIKSLK